MQSRRQFIGATALASIPMAYAFKEGDAFAQAASGAATTGTEDTSGRVLRQIAAENARAYNDAKRNGTRPEHFRAASANLRVFAALNLDDQLRRSARQQLRAHGGDGFAVSRHLEHGRLQRELRDAGMAVPAGELERVLLQFQPTQKVIDEVTAPGFSLSAHLRMVATLLEKDSAVAARLDTGPYHRVVQQVDCQKYTYEINLVSFAVAIFCMSGAAPACVAALTSLLLLQTAMYAAGC